jgi:hypothetical protein
MGSSLTKILGIQPLKKNLLMLMGSQAEGIACTDPGARTTIGVSGKLDQLALQDLLIMGHHQEIKQAKLGTLSKLPCRCFKTITKNTYVNLKLNL